MKLCIVTGEASGDLHAAGVIRELRQIDPTLEVFGIGGDRLLQQNVRLVHDIHELGVVGLFNVLRQLPMFRRVFGDIVAEIERERPDAVILVDFPGFNLRLAKRCRKAGIAVIYFISPQVWAWKKERVHQIAKTVDHMLVIFPFEEEFYREHGVAVTYVGHPLVEQSEGVRRPPGPPQDPVRIALMPGSRRHEIDSLLPPMLEALAVLAKSHRVIARLVKAPTITDELLEGHLRSSSIPVEITGGDARHVLAESDLCLCTSGTATLEVAIVGVPLVVVYKLTTLTYLVARRLVKLQHFSLVNIVAGKEIVPELLQRDASGPGIAAAAERLLEPVAYQRTMQDLAAVREKLGQSGAARRAAEKIAKLVADFRSAHSSPPSR